MTSSATLSVDPLSTGTQQLIEALDREALYTLVCSFYERVRHDALLHPIFDGKVAADAWPHHLEKMTEFWSSVLLGSKSFVGNPMARHAELLDTVPDFGARYFEHWLDLFDDTVRRLFVPDIADEVMLRARNMGAGLLRAVERQASYSGLSQTVA